MTTPEEDKELGVKLSELIAIHRMMEHADYPIFWSVLSRHFCLDESVFTVDRPDLAVIFAAKRDGQRDVMNFIRNIRLAPTPAEDEEQPE